MSLLGNLFKRKTGEVIKKECYDKLPGHEQEHYSETTEHKEPTHEVITREDAEGSSFGLSMLMGMETGSAMDGMLAGGSITGAILGSHLAQQDKANDDGPAYADATSDNTTDNTQESN